MQLNNELFSSNRLIIRKEERYAENKVLEIIINWNVNSGFISIDWQIKDPHYLLAYLHINFLLSNINLWL